MGKIVRLTEGQLVSLVKKVLKEQDDSHYWASCGSKRCKRDALKLYNSCIKPNLGVIKKIESLFGSKFEQIEVGEGVGWIGTSMDINFKKSLLVITLEPNCVMTIMGNTIPDRGDLFEIKEKEIVKILKSMNMEKYFGYHGNSLKSVELPVKEPNLISFLLKLKQFLNS